MTTFKLPDLGEGLPDAEIVRWHVQVGDRVQLDAPMLAVETAKAVVEIPAPLSGIVRALHASSGDLVQTGAPLIDLEAEGAAEEPAGIQPAADTRAAEDSGTVVGRMPNGTESQALEVASVSANGSTERTAEPVRAAPATRALAKRLGVELAGLRGSGRGGLITLDDVIGAAGTASAVAGAGGAAPHPDAKPAARGATGAPERLRGLRRAMAHSMSLARDNVVGCTLFDTADLHEWSAGTDYTIRLLRAIAAGCRAEPGLNAWFNGEAQTRREMPRIDVAMAVDTPDGLLAPVVRDVATRSDEALRRDVDRLKRAAVARTVAAEELRDFTIMLTNFGTMAGRYATPIVVPPAVAILGSGRVSHDVIAVMGRIEAHLRMPLSLTFDHRCVTGGEAARFLHAVIADLQRAR
jgi:2-oxoisovalerate dehydrogenase E2 component (dihydrolipoyl transacylase)